MDNLRITEIDEMRIRVNFMLRCVLGFYVREFGSRQPPFCQRCVDEP